MIQEGTTLLVTGVILFILVLIAVYGLLQAARKSDRTRVSRLRSLEKLERALHDGTISSVKYRRLKHQLLQDEHIHEKAENNV